MRPPRVVDVGEQVLEPARLGARDSRASSCSMRSSTGICSGGSSTFGRCFARSSTRLERGRCRLNRSTSSSGSYSSPAMLGDALVRALPLRGAQRLALVQQFRGGLELLVLEQPPHQRVARILFLALDAGGRLGARQQHLRLDVDERRGHHQEFARDVEVQLLHQLDRVEVLLRDERDRDVVDVDLVLPDEVQQQVERPLEVVELDRVRVRRDDSNSGCCGSVVIGRYFVEIFIASRTRSIVSRRSARARPSRRTGSRAGGPAWPARRRAARGSARGAR